MAVLICLEAHACYWKSVPLLLEDERLRTCLHYLDEPITSHNGQMLTVRTELHTTRCILMHFHYVDWIVWCLVLPLNEIARLTSLSSQSIDIPSIHREAAASH